MPTACATTPETRETARTARKAGAGVGQRTYANHEFDPSTSLSYMGARYYDANLGRFLSEDPAFMEIGDADRFGKDTGMDERLALADPQIMNSYAYAKNNPLKQIDKTGKLPEAVIGAGLGLVAQYAMDVSSNIANNGFHGSDFTSNLSSPQTYLLRAGQGALIVMTGGIASVAGAGPLGVALTSGSTATVTSLGIDKALGNKPNVTGAVIDGVMTMVTSGLSELAPDVPGRLPKFGTDAFFGGKHVQAQALQLGVEALSGISSFNLNKVFSGLLGNAKKGNDKNKIK